MDRMRQMKPGPRPEERRATDKREANQKRSYKGRFYFDPKDPIYEDHFPGRPVVPGSLIVHAFITAASSLTGALKTGGVENFRFKQFVTPGSYSYRLDLRETGNGAPAWFCRLLDGDRELVSGVLK